LVGETFSRSLDVHAVGRKLWKSNASQVEAGRNHTTIQIGVAMLNTTYRFAASFGIFVYLLTALAQAQQPHWQQRLSERLPLFGHRNWVVIADSAYPLQSREGIETIATGEEQTAVLQHVLGALNQSKHVRPVIYLDAELPFVAEQDAPGVSAYRNSLASLSKNQPKHSLPHEEIISKLDKSAQTFNVLILKTNMRLPYTSVFIELDCGYWSAEAERRLREKMESQSVSPTVNP
jgi:hypothetical protein